MHRDLQRRVPGARLSVAVSRVRGDRDSVRAESGSRCATRLGLAADLPRLARAERALRTAGGVQLEALHLDRRWEARVVERLGCNGGLLPSVRRWNDAGAGVHRRGGPPRRRARRRDLPRVLETAVRFRSRGSGSDDDAGRRSVHHRGCGESTDRVSISWGLLVPGRDRLRPGDARLPVPGSDWASEARLQYRRRPGRVGAHLARRGGGEP